LASVPKPRAPAAAPYRILAREKSEATREFSTVTAPCATTTWLAMPVDYPRFWKKDEEGRYPRLGEHDRWHGALARCLGDGIEVLPVVPRYDDQEMPYVARVGSTDPVRLRLVFDDRYMAVSDELNLLNTILLDGGGGEAKSAATRKNRSYPGGVGFPTARGSFCTGLFLPHSAQLVHKSLAILNHRAYSFSYDRTREPSIARRGNRTTEYDECGGGAHHQSVSRLGAHTRPTASRDQDRP